jgi:hypothetical protein
VEKVGPSKCLLAYGLRAHLNRRNEKKGIGKIQDSDRNVNIKQRIAKHKNNRLIGSQESVERNRLEEKFLRG